MRRLRASVSSGIPGPGGGLFSLRWLRRSACGAFFSCLYVHLGLIFYAQAAGILAWCPFGVSQGLSLASRGPLVYAQAAWIRLRHFLYIMAYTSGAFVLCAGCGDPCLLHFGFSQERPAASRCRCGGYFFTQTASICVRKHLIVTPAREPLQAKGSLGLVWAVWARLGVPRLSETLPNSPELS